MSGLLNKKYLLVIDHIMTGGAERILVDYYHHLESKGAKPFVFVLSGHEGQSPWTEGLRVVYGTSGDEDNLFRKGLQQMKLYLSLSRMAYQIKPDVIFSFLEKSNLLTMLLQVNAVKVVTVHNVLSIQYTKVKSNIVRNILYAMIRWAYNKCPRVIAVSGQVRDDLVTVFSVTPSHISVINNYVNRNVVRKMSHEKFTDFNFEDNCRYLMTVGRFSDQKAQWKLVKAFSVCIKRGMNKTKLLLMGNGLYGEQLKQLAIDLGIANYVTFLPFNVNPYKYMSKADLFVLSSNFEGFPIVLAEASSLRIPFVGSNKALPQEMFDDQRVWKQATVDIQSRECDFSTSIHADEVELSRLMEKGLTDNNFRKMILEHTLDWEKVNNKENQFYLYDKISECN